MYSGLLLGQGDVLTMFSSAKTYHVQWSIDGLGGVLSMLSSPSVYRVHWPIVGPGRRVQTARQRLISQSIVVNIKTISSF